MSSSALRLPTELVRPASAPSARARAAPELDPHRATSAREVEYDRAAHAQPWEGRSPKPLQVRMLAHLCACAYVCVCECVHTTRACG